MSVPVFICWTQCETKLCIRSPCKLCQGPRAPPPRTRMHTPTRTHMQALSLLTEGLAEWVMRKGPHA